VSRWWESAVVYQVYPRSFQDSDGDGIGDLNGIISRLDYVASLGVDAIWLSPVYPSPGADLGYDIADHCDVDPLFGSLDDLDRLILAVHERGLRFLLDLVPSHTSIEHPWFREHPDWYVWSDDGPANNWAGAFGGSAWTRDPRSGRWYLHSFFPEQPDLDWRNPEVREAFAGVAGFWLDRGVDGFRVDAADRLGKDDALRDDPIASEPFPFPLDPEAARLEPRHSRGSGDISRALATLREAVGDAYLVGEVYLPAPRLGEYLRWFDSAFSFDLLHAPWQAPALRRTLLGDAALDGIAWVIANHDFSRVASRWGPEHARVAAMLLLTLPGPAFVYQGEELGMVDGPGGSPPVDRFGRDRFRHPMQWDRSEHGGFTDGRPWLPSVDPGDRNAQDESRDPDSMLSLYRRLIAARRDLSGPLHGVELDGELLSYRRGEGHLVLLNLGDAPRSDPRLEPGQILVETGRGAVVGEGLAPGAGAMIGLASPQADV
jgi:alpha-glucosidase